MTKNRKMNKIIFKGKKKEKKWPNNLKNNRN